MAAMIFCVKLKQQAEQLPHPPLPGELGKKIYDSISKPAWLQWIAHQTILINEYRLNLLDEEARTFLLKEMEQFLFVTDS